MTFSVIHWINVFCRQRYFDCMVESLKFAQEHKKLELYAYCIMPNHVHMVMRAPNGDPGMILNQMKSYTSKTIRDMIIHRHGESRRDWIIPMMRDKALIMSNGKDYQFWQHSNYPIELWSPAVIDQKVNYIHQNPVVAGYVDDPTHWKHSSARNYDEQDGPLDILVV